MLSSEILEEQFGPTRLVILKQNSKQRIIETLAKDTKQVLELSVVTFDQENIHTFQEIHKKVIAGTSIGKAYKQAGVSFTRKVNSTVRTILPAVLEAEFNQKGLTTIVEVDIYVGKQKIHYCHILEIYSPDVAWPK
jgi:F0F1-type ATP synthase delta subunit